MRVITGTAKGRNLEAPSRGTRPLTDRIKTSIFDLIREFIPNAKILDLYAGSGSFGIEALSRGADYAVFVDYGFEATNIIQRNLKKTDFTDKSEVHKVKVNDFIVKTDQDFDLIFLDPPFDDKIDPDFSGLAKILKDDGLLIYRTVQNKKIEQRNFEVIFQKIYGVSKVVFMKKNNQS